MTYALLALCWLVAAAVLVLVAVRRTGTAFLLPCVVTALVLVVLTVVCDSLMVAADLFRYDAASLLGPRVWRAPVEDLAWPVVAAFALPAAWRLATPSTARPPARVEAGR